MVPPLPLLKLLCLELSFFFIAHSHAYAHRLSSSILTELLRTYSEADAKDATQLAEKLIALVISDPKQFVFDNLLQLAPIAALEGQRSLQVR